MDVEKLNREMMNTTGQKCVRMCVLVCVCARALETMLEKRPQHCCAAQYLEESEALVFLFLPPLFEKENLMA